MEKTLQQQYNLIKEGKGNKDDFLKSARRVFPEFITSLTNYNDAVTILKGKSILNEGVGGVATQNPNKPDWFKIFDTNLKEAVGVKNKKEYGDQNEFEKIDKDVAKDLESNFDNNDPKNIDNLYGQSFLLGYLTEMGDPKNAKKTVDELKAIVAKNMAKDINYYHTNASFGVKGIGYTKDVVGGGEPKAPKGKYKSSGYGDMPKVVKEGKLRSLINQIIKEGPDKQIDIDDKREFVMDKIQSMDKEEFISFLKKIDEYDIWKEFRRAFSDPEERVNVIDMAFEDDAIENYYDELSNLNENKESSDLKKKEDLHKKIEKYYGRKLSSSQINTMMGKDDEIADLISKYRKLSKELNESRPHYTPSIGSTAYNKFAYSISKSGSKANPVYVLEKPDGSEMLDMMFDTPEDAKEYARKRGLYIVSSTIKESSIPSYERLSNMNPVKSKGNYIIVRFAYDDEGNNAFALLDTKNQKIVSYSLTGASEIKKFEDLKESINKNKLHSLINQIIKEELNEYAEDEFDRSPEMYSKGKSPREGKDGMDFFDAKKLAYSISREGVVQHVNELPDGSYEVSDWYDADTTVISYENGIEL